MDTVRQHVSASGNSTLRGYFGSESVEFDPPTDSLRHNIKKQKAKQVYDLASGATGDAEEDEIRDLISGSQNSYEVIRMYGAIDGWDGLDDELPEGHLDKIAANTAQVLDQRDYPVYQLIRRYLGLLDYGNSPTLGDCFERLLTWPPEFHADEIDVLLGGRAELLKRVASATMRQRTNMVNAARVHVDVINHYLAANPPHANDLVQFMHEVNYTTTICSLLAELKFGLMYPYIADMVDPGPPMTTVQRIACRETFKRLSPELSAAAKAVESVGKNEDKLIVNKFMLTLKTTLDNFPATVPAPNIVSMVAAAIASIATDIAQLRAAIFALPDYLVGITLPDLLGSSDDDKARLLISELNTQGNLARLSFTVKNKLIGALLNGFTVDDDEIAILRVMESAKAYDQAELYQLAGAATWDSLNTSMDGDEWDALEAALHQPG